jgi:hypothetical protein
MAKLTGRRSAAVIYDELIYEEKHMDIDQGGNVVELVYLTQEQMLQGHVGCKSRCRKFCMYYSRTRDLMLGRMDYCTFDKRGVADRQAGCATGYYKKVTDAES